MTFDEAMAELIAEGFPADKIRRMKVRVVKDPENDLSTGVWPVFETSKAIRAEVGEQQREAKIIHYKLDEGEIDPALGEFWIPCAYHGNQGWVNNYCAPEWLKSEKAQKDFCERYLRKRENSWPDTGERSADPIAYLNDQLAGSLITGLKASDQLPKRKRERMAKDFQRFNDITFDYLSEAIELSLKKNEPPYRQITRENMKQGEGLTEWHDQEAARIIELAFRAGKAAAQATMHYRGIPVFAERGERPVATELDGSRLKTKNDLSECDRRVLELMDDRSLLMEEVYDIVEKEGLLKTHKKGHSVKPSGRPRFIKKKSYWDLLKRFKKKGL